MQNSKCFSFSQVFTAKPGHVLYIYTKTLNNTVVQVLQSDTFDVLFSVGSSNWPEDAFFRALKDNVTIKIRKYDQQQKHSSGVIYIRNIPGKEFFACKLELRSEHVSSSCHHWSQYSPTISTNSLAEAMFLHPKTLAFFGD